MRQLFCIVAPFVRLASMVALSCAFPMSSAKAAEINFTTDTKVTATACLAHLSGRPPDNSVARAGFSVGMKNKGGTTYIKKTKGGLISTKFWYGALHKRKDPTDRRCTLAITVPNRIMAERQSPEFHDFITALRGVMKANGYKRGTAKNRFGQDEETWTGGGRIYALSLLISSGNIMVEITPK